MSKEIAVSQSAQVETFISQAIAANLPVESMERLFALRKEVKAELAKEQFTVALGKFQGECPTIKKTKKVNDKAGKLRYQYAPLDGIADQIRKSLAKNRLAYSWDVKNIEGHMQVTCKITHVLGHFETSMFEIPVDKEAYMSAPQKYASAQTFAKRYTLINALGISTGDEDQDANDVGKEPTPKSEKSQIVFLLKELKQKTGTAAECSDAVKKLTSLVLEEKNFGQIIDRLEVIVEERHENA